jgi:hypothetical protein
MQLLRRYGEGEGELDMDLKKGAVDPLTQMVGGAVQVESS